MSDDKPQVGRVTFGLQTGLVTPQPQGPIKWTIPMDPTSWETELSRLQAENERLREALFGGNGALTRMDRARRILHKGPDTNWGVLDTSDIQAGTPGKETGDA